MRLSSAARLSDTGFLAKEITDWKKDPKRKMQISGEDYYNGRHAILKAVRKVIGRDGKMQEAPYLPNCRIVDNQYANAVDKKVNYLLGKPLTFDTQNRAYAEALGTVLNSAFFRTLRNVGEDSLNGGIGWIMPHYDEEGNFCLHRFEPYEILPFWRDAAHTKLDAAVRLYEAEEYEGMTRKITEHVEVFTPEGIVYYRRSGEALVPEEPFYTPYVFADGEAQAWSRIPLVAFKYNAKEQPLICRVKSLQDGINTITSNFENNLLEDPHNTILVIVNAEGTDLGEFRHNLARYGAVKVRNDAAHPGGDVKTLNVEVNAENYKAILKIFKDAFTENARSYDAKDDRMGNNPNEMNLLSMYSDIDLDANGMEAEYQAAFEELLWFVNMHLLHTGQGDFENEPVKVIFNRDVMMNTSERITQVKNSVGILSQRTLLSNHPFVKDVDAELKLLKKEQEEERQTMEDYGGTFGQHCHAGTDEQDGA